MQLEILVEEPSMKAALEVLLPKLLRPTDAKPRILDFEGITSLFDELPAKLKAYRGHVPPGQRIIIVCDRDKADCRQRKAKLEDIVARAGLYTRARPHYSGTWQVLTCLAIEELEAWFLGDPAAVSLAYPKVKPAAFRDCVDPDAVPDAAEKLRDILRGVKELDAATTKLPKVPTARRIAPHLNPDTNASASFRHFCGAVRACFGADTDGS